MDARKIRIYFKIAKAIVLYKLFRKKRPLFIGWELTNRCNYACRYCRVKGETFHAGNELDTQRVLSIIKDLSMAGCAAIAFSGGECLLRDDIGEIISCAHALGIITKITTNGKVLPQKVSQIRLVDYITISLDGSPDTHDALRGPGSFAEVEMAVESAVMHKKNVTLNMVLTRQSIADIPFVVDFARRKGAGISFQPLEERAFSFDAMRDVVPTQEQMKEAIDMIMHLKAEMPALIRNPLYVLKELRQWPDFCCFHCYAGKLHYRITPHGMLRACNYQQDGHQVNILHYAHVMDAIKHLPEVKVAKGCCAVYTKELNAMMDCHIKAIFSRLIS